MQHTKVNFIVICNSKFQISNSANLCSSNGLVRNFEFSFLNFKTMEYSYETLLEENTELRKALTRSKEMVERFRSDNDSIKQVHDDFKYHYDKLKKDCNLYQARCTEAEQTKKEIEQNYDSMVRRFKTQIETKQKDLDELSERVAPPIDNEMLRLRLVSEVEAPYKVALEQKQAEIGSLEHQTSDM